MAYIPPNGDLADFELLPYTPPAGDQVNFELEDMPSDERDFTLTGSGTSNDRNFKLTGVGYESERTFTLTGKKFVPTGRNYRILVKDENGNFIGEFENYRALKFGKRLNNYGVASFEIPVIDPKLADLISLRRYTVWIYYQQNAIYTLVWSGEQAERVGDLDNAGNNWATIYCYTWLEQLSARYTRYTRRFSDVDAGQIAWTLIDESQHLVTDSDSALDEPDAAANNSGVGTVDWSSISTSGGVSASVDFGSSDAARTSHYLKITDFDFAIPANSIITGIQVNVGWYQEGASGLARDSHVKLIKAGTIQSENKATNELIARDVFGNVVPYGGEEDLWEDAWTLSDINNSGFGVALAVDGSLGITRGCIVDLESVEIVVTYYTLSVDANSDFGITEGTIEATIDRDRTYHNDNIMESIVNLTNVLSGFDFDITDEKVFNVYSLKGVDLSNDLVLEYGVNIDSVHLIEDFTTPANKAIILGQSTDDTTSLVRIERNDTGLQDTYKIRESLSTEMDVVDTITMEDKGDALIRKYGTALFKIDINLLKSSVAIVDFSIGDLIKLIIQSGIYDVNQDYRIFEWEISFNTDNSEVLSLILGKFTI